MSASSTSCQATIGSTQQMLLKIEVRRKCKHVSFSCLQDQLEKLTAKLDEDCFTYCPSCRPSQLFVDARLVLSPGYIVHRRPNGTSRQPRRTSAELAKVFTFGSFSEAKGGTFSALQEVAQMCATGVFHCFCLRWISMFPAGEVLLGTCFFSLPVS